MTSYSSGLLEDFSSAKRSWKPKTSSPVKTKAKSSHAELPSLFASTVARNPTRRKGNTAVAPKNGNVQEASNQVSPPTTCNRSNRSSVGTTTKPPMMPPAVSENKRTVPSPFKPGASAYGRGFPSPTTQQGGTSMSPEKPKSKSGKIVIRKKTERESSPKRPGSMKWSSKDSDATSSTSGSPTADSGTRNTPPVSPCKSKIKVKSKSCQIDYNCFPSQKQKRETATKVIPNTISNEASTTMAFQETIPKSSKLSRAEVMATKWESNSPRHTVVMQQKSLGNHGLSPNRQISNIPNSQASQLDTRPDNRATESHVKHRIATCVNTMVDTKKTGSVVSPGQSSSPVKSSKAPPGSFSSASSRPSSDKTGTAPVPKITISRPPTFFDEDSDILTPLKPAIFTTPNSASPRRTAKYSVCTPTATRNKNKVVPVAPFSVEKRSCTPALQSTTTATKMVASVTPQSEVRNNQENKAEDSDKEKIPLVTIDASGSNPQMIISFDNDEYNPIDEDELSCSVATAMFGPPSPLKNTLRKLEGASGASDPASLVSLLSQEEQLELFKTLEKLHKSRQKT